jgi:hypothetical protein
MANRSRGDSEDLDPDPENLNRLTEALTKLESTLPTVAERPFEAAKDAANLPEE